MYYVKKTNKWAYFEDVYNNLLMLDNPFKQEEEEDNHWNPPDGDEYDIDVFFDFGKVMEPVQKDPSDDFEPIALKSTRESEKEESHLR